MDVANEQREASQALITWPSHRVDGRGRPWQEAGDALDGILKALCALGASSSG
jgi:hypothetical protein